MFKRFTSEPAKNIWIINFCSNNGGEDCKRKALRNQGKSPEEIPDDLLPNGEYMKSVPAS